MSISETQYTNYLKQQLKAREILKNLELNKKKAILKNKQKYCASYNSGLYLKNPLNVDDYPLPVKFRIANNSLVCPNEFIYSLAKSEKINFGTIFKLSKKHKNVAKTKQKVLLEVINYYISEINGKAYETTINADLLYNYSDYRDLNCDYELLYQYEPVDFTFTYNLIINESKVANIYRLDNNIQNNPHLNRLENGKILLKPKIITGPHEHEYDELFAILYSQFPYSFDANPLHSMRTDMPGVENPPLLKSEAEFLIQNKLNLSSSPLPKSLSLSNNGFDLVEANEMIEQLLIK